MRPFGDLHGIKTQQEAASLSRGQLSRTACAVPSSIRNKVPRTIRNKLIYKLTRLGFCFSSRTKTYLINSSLYFFWSEGTGV
jgi:hypothetical protein